MTTNLQGARTCKRRGAQSGAFERWPWGLPPPFLKLCDSPEGTIKAVLFWLKISMWPSCGLLARFFPPAFFLPFKLPNVLAMFFSNVDRLLTPFIWEMLSMSVFWSELLLVFLACSSTSSRLYRSVREASSWLASDCRLYRESTWSLSWILEAICLKFFCFLVSTSFFCCLRRRSFIVLVHAGSTNSLPYR